MSDNDLITPNLPPKHEPVTRHLKNKVDGVAFYGKRDTPVAQTIDRLGEIKKYKIRDFYRPELIERSLAEHLKTRSLDTVAPKDYVNYVKQELKRESLQDEYAEMITKLQAKPEAVAKYYESYQDSYLVETLRPALADGIDHAKLLDSKELIELIPLTDGVVTTKKSNNGKIMGYTVPDQKALESFIKTKLATDSNIRQLGTISENETQQGSTNLGDLYDTIKAIETLAEISGISLGEQPDRDKGTININTAYIRLESLLNNTLYQMVKITKAKPYNLDRDKPVEQTNLFSNMAIGVDTAEITGRHQFFSPMFRGFMGLGESGLYEAINVANRRNSNVTIPYETKGSSSVYKTKLQTSVDISGVEKALITDEAKAQRFTARLIKAQGILYLWAMHTNSLTIYNTKITDMLRLTGYEGRIKPEHYIDITEGIAGLFAIAVTKTDDNYTDPKTGKKVYVGKNEMYGEVVRPIGEVRAIWHKGSDGKPAYIKQLIRLEIAKGMLNPTARRATLVSKALLRLNTLQERQYLQLGSLISDQFSQFQDNTILGEPIDLKLQTLLEYRGLTDPDSLRRVEQTKTYLKQALDKLVDIGHIARWAVKNGNYEKLTLTGKDLDTVILIYPTASIQETLKGVINDDDKALTTILTQEVRADGLTTTAEHYKTNTESIEAVINNRDTADSLPNNAYNELKTKAYDKGKASKKKRAN